MAQKTNGNFDFAFNFEVNLEGPLDARLTVENHSDLSSVPLKYDGMVVSVVDDALSENNGVYYYLDSSESWTKILDAGDTLESGASVLNDLTDVSAASPSTGQVLKWDGSSWAAATDNSGTGSSDTISDGDSDVTVIDGNPDTIQFTVDNTHCWSFNRYGHLLPVTNETYDIGSAERKVRHLYLSSNSLWLGELNKITIDPSTAEIKFQKRNPSSIPVALTNIGITESDVLSNSKKASLELVTLTDYEQIAEANGLTIDDLFPSEDSAVFETSKSLSAIESGNTRPSEIDIDASVKTIDITQRFLSADGGIFVIRDSTNGVRLDLSAVTKSGNTNTYEIYDSSQGSINISITGPQVYSVFDDTSKQAITALPGQFVKLWYNASTSRWEYLYRSI